MIKQQFDDALTDVDGGSSVGRYTRYYYDGIGQLIKVSDPGSEIWNYTYDAFGNRESADDPDLGVWTLTYDENNNLNEQLDAKGQIIRFTYDALDRPTEKKVLGGSNGTQITSYTYDQPQSGYYNVGQLTTQNVGNHTIQTDYGKQGLVERTQHTIGSTIYTMQGVYAKTGSLLKQSLPYLPGSTNVSWTSQAVYDAADRLTGFGNQITNVTYDLWGNAEQIDYGNGTLEEGAFSVSRGWVTRQSVFDLNGARRSDTRYTRTATGRVSRMRTEYGEGEYDYTYDYAGRLLSAINYGGNTTYDQTFTYDRAGNMRSNNQVGTYQYYSSGPQHAPNVVGLETFAYDANGNMTTGLDGKAMTYDGENRPLSVALNGVVTSYVYGADGSRLKKTVGSDVTVTFGDVEIRKFGQGASEEILTYPHLNIRLVNGVASYMHRDQLGSVRAIFNAAGTWARISTYWPFGEFTEHVNDATESFDAHGFIGERYDADAGLQYLNARYYDPKLGMFIQPDWLEVTMAGVGTNRYAYSGNDPVNLRDPNGNFFDEKMFELLISKTVSTVTTGTKVVLGTVALAVTLALTPSELAMGTIQVNLTDEDRREGYYQDENGNTFDSEGNQVNPFSIPSQKGTNNSGTQESSVHTSQETFNEARYSISDPRERMSYTRTELSKIASENGWVRDGRRSRKAGRDVYKTLDGSLRTSDVTHGQFEKHSSRGKHQGQEDIDGNQTKDSDTSYDY